LEEITIQKTTALGLAGLMLAIMIGGYVVLRAPQAPQSSMPEGTAGTIGIANPQGTADLQGNATQVSQDTGAQAVQDIYIRALSSGSYDTQQVTVKAGVPVRLHFTADPNAGCGRQMLIYGLDVRVVSKSGEEDIAEFTPQQPGTYEYNCGMRMWRPGTLVVV
jgi:Cupredoxin-like domain